MGGDHLARALRNDTRLKVVVASRTREAEGIVSLQLKSADGSVLPPFEAGAHIDLHLPNGVIRQYSLCQHPDQLSTYRIGVLLDESSRGGSRAVHQLKTGDDVEISGPRNNFPLVAGKGRVLLVGGGIGITPLISMANTLHADGHEFSLHYCGRSLRRMAFRQELRSSPFGSRVWFHADDGDAAQKFTPACLADDSVKSQLYICGPSGFIKFVTETAVAQGWPNAAIHVEHFRPLSDIFAGDTFLVELARSGRIVTVPPNVSIAQALVAAGVPIDVSCEQGLCGTCLTPLLDGIADHRDSYQTSDEKLENMQIALCCSRAKSRTLRLDL